MSETKIKTTVLYEAAQIGAGRRLLREAKQRIDREGYACDEGGEGFRYGLLSEALDNAETALFNALNIATNMLDCDESRAALDAHRT